MTRFSKELWVFNNSGVEVCLNLPHYKCETTLIKKEKKKKTMNLLFGSWVMADVKGQRLVKGWPCVYFVPDHKD